MPQVPSVDAPTVMPNGGPTQVNTPDAAFGLNVLGRGLEEAGIAAETQSDRLAQHAEQFQAINNKAEADQAFVTHIQQANQYVADYQANNRGMKAYTALPGALKDLSAQRQAIGETLSNPMSRAMFDADSRRAVSNLSGELSRFAASQRKDYVVHQAKAVQEALTSDTALHPENADENGIKLQAQQLFINDQLGLSPEEGQLEARKAYGQMISTASLAMAGNGNITGAAEFLDKHKANMDGVVYEQTLTRLRPAMMANDAASAGDLAVATATHGIDSPTGPTQDFIRNVHGREGSGQNPRSSANGVGQFLGKVDAQHPQGTGTWFDIMKDPEFAQDVAGKTPQQILAMRKDPAVADRAIAVYAKQNAASPQMAGLPINPATLGMAHGFGPGGAAALLKADVNANAGAVLGPQVTKANPELAHQTVGQVIAGFSQRFGTGVSVNSTAGGAPSSFELQGRMQSVLANADAIAERQVPGNAAYKDQVEQRAIAGLNRQITAAKDAEFNAYTSLGTAIEANNIQDFNTLMKQPGALQSWNTLPLSQRNALTADMNREATSITPQRAANIQLLNGMYGDRHNNPQAFLNADIASMDLPRQQRLAFLKAQAELRGKPATALNGDKMLASVLKSPQVGAQLNTLGIKKSDNPDDYYHFAGALQGELDNWNAQHKDVPPGPKDIARMIANVSAEKFATYGLSGTTMFDHKVSQGRGFDIQDEDAAKATEFLKSRNLPVNAQTIGQYTHERGIIAQQAKARGYNVTDADLDNIYAARVSGGR